MPRFVVGFCLLLVTACYRESPVAPWPIDQEVTLAPGQTAGVDGASLSLRFSGVTGDSRCPADAICVTGGSATVHVQLFGSGGGRQDIAFETGNPKPVTAGSVTFELVQLAPYPFSTTPIEPEDYRATIRARR